MKRIVCSLLAAAIFWPGLATAQSVRLSVPDTTAPRGSEVLLPVSVDSTLSGRSVTAFELQFQFNDQLIDPDSVVLAGTLLEGSAWSILTHRPAPNLLRIAGAGTTALDGTGVLFFVRLKLKTQGWSQFIFAETAHNLLNQGDPPIVVKNGSVSVEAAPSIGISPDGDVLAVGEQRSFTAYSGQGPYFWSTTDPAIATITPEGVLTALALGSVRVVVQDATGLRDTTNQPVVVRAMGVGVPDTSVSAGSMLDLPVSVTTLSGLGVTAGSFRLAFNGDLLTPTAIITTGTVLQSVTPVVNLSVKGRADVSFATATPLTGSGVLFIVRFQAAATASWSGMTIAQGLFNQDVMPKVRNGSVTLASLSTIWMSMSRLTLVAGDSLLITPGNGQAPYTWTTTDTTVARMDAAGHLIGLRSGTVRVVVRDALGAQGTSDVFQVFDGSVVIPDMVAASGTSVDVPVFLERLTPGNDISSFQLRLSYDSTHIVFDSLMTAGTLTGTWALTFHSAPPLLTMAGATAGSFSATGELLKVRFSVKPSVPTGTQAGVRFDHMLFNEGLPFVKEEDGIITIAGVPDASSLWSPGDGWTDQPVTLQFQWQGVSYAETYHLQIATDASFTLLIVNDSTLEATTTWKGPLAHSTVYYWRVRARNSVGAGPWTAHFQFQTVATAPTPPVLASPAHNAVDLNLTPELRWHPSAQAVTYDIQIAEDSTFVTDVRTVGGVTDTSHTLGALDYGRRYHWRVRAVNQAGWSEWSLSWAFSTGIAPASTPVLAEPLSGSIGIPISPTLRWHRSVDAATYQVQLAIDELFTSVVFDSSGVVDSQLTITELLHGSVYYWRVRGVNAGGMSEWTNAWFFETIVGSPAIPVLGTPIDLSVGVILSPLLRWHRAAYAQAYDLQVADDALFANILISATSIPDTSYPIGPLQPLHQYYWRVRSLNSVDTSVYSPMFQFMTGTTDAVTADPGAIPEEYGLDPNYPNPFNPETEIAFRVKEASFVTISIYSLHCVEVIQLVGGEMPAGRYRVRWSATNMSSGIYLCRMTAGQFTSTQRMILLK